ncbi:MAG: hypothetical protein BKP49_04420 [Treponema sp. CETP13]|nr:MAG: hypothetical protein BKP49_04420 [Treponema sp. CETP13]
MNVESFLLCDDIRNEIGGKKSLMGVYGDNIIFEVPENAADRWPKALRLGIFIKLSMDDDGIDYDYITFTLHTELNSIKNKIGEGKIDLTKNPTRNKSLSIAIMQERMRIDDVGQLKFEINCYYNGKEIPMNNNTILIEVSQNLHK